MASRATYPHNIDIDSLDSADRAACHIERAQDQKPASDLYQGQVLAEKQHCQGDRHDRLEIEKQGGIRGTDSTHRKKTETDADNIKARSNGQRKNAQEARGKKGRFQNDHHAPDQDQAYKIAIEENGHRVMAPSQVPHLKEQQCHTEGCTQRKRNPKRIEVGDIRSKRSGQSEEGREKGKHLRRPEPARLDEGRSDEHDQGKGVEQQRRKPYRNVGDRKQIADREARQSKACYQKGGGVRACRPQGLPGSPQEGAEYDTCHCKAYDKERNGRGAGVIR